MMLSGWIVAAYVVIGALLMPPDDDYSLSNRLYFLAIGIPFLLAYYSMVTAWYVYLRGQALLRGKAR